MRLATGVRDRRLCAALYASAHDDIRKALELRKTGRALVYVATSAVVGGLITIAIPFYVVNVPTAGRGWVGIFWLTAWFVYLGLTLVLGIALARLLALRSRHLA